MFHLENAIRKGADLSITAAYENIVTGRPSASTIVVGGKLCE